VSSTSSILSHTGAVTKWHPPPGTVRPSPSSCLYGVWSLLQRGHLCDAEVDDVVHGGHAEFGGSKVTRRR
jgi:hypothetical protein